MGNARKNWEMLTEVTSTGVSPVAQLVNPVENQGTSTVGSDGTGTWTVQVEGRATEEAPWAIIATLTNANVVGTATDNAMVNHPTLNQMRHNLTAVGGGASVTSEMLD